MCRGRATMNRSNLIRIFLWTFAFLAFSTFSDAAGTKNCSAHGLCPSMYIRNDVKDLQRLQCCRVIEGNLQISLIDNGTHDDYQNYSFPELREITGYFLLAHANGLSSLRTLFPNLVVIRGHYFLYNYAFVISDMPDMQEIGLSSLTSIMERGVYIAGNPNLCYVDTIDWAKITNESSVNYIGKNKPNQCPNSCPQNLCPKAETDARNLCWSNTDCQIVHKEKCPGCGGRTCAADGECCDEECLGGCKVPRSASNCFACKNVEILYDSKPGKVEVVCRTRCTGDFYEYMNRRCVTEDDCRSIVLSDPKKAGHRLRGKILNGHNGRNLCVLECPGNYKLEIDEEGEKCEKCIGPCKKVCPGAFVDSVELSAILKGCTTVNGTLKIQIRGYSPNLVRELEKNMEMIEDIEGSLVVANTHSLSSLNFLRSLKKIHGNILEENAYAVVVKLNENIQDLWNRTNAESVRILRTDARVLFHYNPKLCRSVIQNFVRRSNISLSKDTDPSIDIGITNGDQVPCNRTELDLRIRRRTNSSVTIQWENFRRNLTDARHLLEYEVYYKVSPEQTASLYEDRNPCGGDDWKVKTVNKISFSGSRDQEPLWQDEYLITGLGFFTQYALYVKTVVLPDNDSPNHNSAAQSRVHYFTTLPHIPSPPRDLTLFSNSSRGIVLSWLPPLKPNGLIEKYEIYLKEEVMNASFHDQRNYCNGRPAVKAAVKEKAIHSFGQREEAQECCSCSAGNARTEQESTLAPVAEPRKFTLFDKEVQDAITNALFFVNPEYKESEEIVARTEVIAPEPISNMIRTERKRRRAISMPEFVSTTEDSKEEAKNFKQFPSNIPTSEHVLMKLGDMKPIVEVWANQTNSEGKMIHFLSNLTHFTQYTISVKACRAVSTEIVNDKSQCSAAVKDTIITLPSESADYIDIASLNVTVIGNKIKLRWDEPAKANGIAMSYNINVTRVDSSKSNEPPHVACITRKMFNTSGRTYDFPKILHPGNYSIRIQVISLAQELANYTIPKYFVILASEEGVSVGHVMAIALPILIFFVMAVAFFTYFVRTRKLVKKITSANPEYLENVDIPEEFEFPRDKIELIKELGTGSFGMVYEGIIKDYKGHSKIKCAVKQVAKGAPSEDRYRFLQEANIMTQMDCHHIIRLLGVVSLSQPTFVIMELMVHGDLKKYLRQRRPDSTYFNGEPPPTLKQILRMAAEIADGMAYLDSKGFVHRDLAARNCMVAEDLTVKVGDFGMTKDTDYYRKSTRGLLPVRWMAPESIKDGIFTIQSDLWSFGVVLWEMATLAAQPYQGLNNDQVIRYVREGGIMERPENCPDILYVMMQRCWAYRVMDRPTFSEICDRLAKEVDNGFIKVSFYHSANGMEYRAKLQARPTHEEQFGSSKTPLRATFEDDLISEDENNSDEDEDPTLLRHGEDIHGNEVDGKSRFRSKITACSLLPSAELPSAFQTTNTPPSSLPINNNNRASPSSAFIPLDLHFLNSHNSDPNRNTRTDQIPPLSTPNALPLLGENRSNGPSGEGMTIHYSPAAEGSVCLSNGPTNNIKSGYNQFPNQKPVNGLISPTIDSHPTFPNFSCTNDGKKSTTEF